MAKGPKMKTVRGAAKRVRRTAKGRLKVKSAKTSHNFSSDSRKTKRQRKGTKVLNKAEEQRLQRCLPYL